MITFRYDALSVGVNDRCLPDIDVFKKTFAEHWQWLEENQISFQVNVFYWPEMSSGRARVISEFDLIIEQVTHAIMFSIFSGMTGTDFDPRSN